MIARIARDAGIDAFIDAISKDGCVVIQDFTDLASLEASVREVQPYLDASLAASAKSTVGALNGGTATCTRLVGRSKTVRDSFFSDPLYQALADYFIGRRTTIWMGAEPTVHTSDPLLSIAITMSSQPGSQPQKLHRDDKNHHARHTAAAQYEQGRDMLLGLFVPACDTRRDNGATRIVPGSHLWGDDRPDFGPTGDAGVEDAELARGEALVMLGSLYHGAGHYAQTTGCRTVHIMFMCSGMYRQEVGQLTGDPLYPVEDVKTYSKLVQDRLGWKQSEPNLGWVDLKSPEFLLE